MAAERAFDPAVVSVTYPGTPASVSAGRHWTRSVLARSPRVDEAELVAAELMTNAIRHSASGQVGGTFTLTVRQRPGWARIEVRDLGNGQWRAQPSACPAGDDSAEQGRGLAIVAALAADCGHEVAEGQTQTCWVALAW
jgi:anti-sigma regulatory factor (Ser/Thr protein kinase)